MWRASRLLTPDGVVDDAWVAASGGVIVATGSGEDAPEAASVVDLGDATLMAGLCDPHVHLGATGLYEAGFSVPADPTGAEVLDACAGAVAAGRLPFGHGYEAPIERDVTAEALERAAGGPAVLVRTDMHSCIVSTGVLAALDLSGVEGVERDPAGNPTGLLREQAAGRAWRWFEASLDRHRHRGSVEAAARLAYSRGVTAVHEMYVVEWRGWDGLEALRETLGGIALRTEIYVASGDVERVAGLGFRHIGGDYFLDGSFGSFTAWLHRPYLDPPEGTPSAGVAYRSDEEVLAFFREAQRHGLQTGVHAIGDAAISQALAAWEVVAEEAGTAAVRALGHRIEHFESASDPAVSRAVRLGLRLSVQPAFDALWGGPGGMYATRIGWARAKTMNRFASFLEAGAHVGAGSDSPVTALDPWVQVDALERHHVVGERLDRRVALSLVGRAAHDLSGPTNVYGSVQAGRSADLVAIAGNIFKFEARAVDVIGTWIAGHRVWPSDLAERP